MANDSYYRLSINRLSKDELTYELGVRGIRKTEPVEQMRKCLRNILRLEKKGKPLSYPPYSLDIDEEIAIISAKIIEIGDAIIAFVGDKKSSDYDKLLTRIHHVLGRANRIQTADRDKLNKRGEFLTEIFELRQKLNDKVSPKDSSNSGSSSDSSISGFDQPAGTSSPSNVKLFKNRDFDNDKVGSVPVLKWGLKFSGEKNDLTVNSFIERVEELCLARNVSHVQLFNSAIDLFTGKCLYWFRLVRKSIKSWKELKVKLREEFLPFDYEDRLLAEIHRRTQGKDESIGLYLSIMDSMFSRLAIPPSASFRLNVLMRNLAPFYQEKLSLVDVSSESELLQICKKIERSKCFVESYKPPTRSRDDVEPDTAYVDSKSSFGVESQCATTSSGNTQKCWNCGTAGHLAKTCKATRRKHCFKCGTPDATKFNCPNCKRSGNDRTRR